jgi:hypothetical protein
MLWSNRTAVMAHLLLLMPILHFVVAIGVVAVVFGTLVSAVFSAVLAATIR